MASIIAKSVIASSLSSARLALLAQRDGHGLDTWQIVGCAPDEGPNSVARPGGRHRIMGAFILLGQAEGESVGQGALALQTVWRPVPPRRSRPMEPLQALSATE